MERNMLYMQIAMKHLPEAKQFLEESGLELNLEQIQPMISLLTKVMDEAYELGLQEGLARKED